MACAPRSFTTGPEATPWFLQRPWDVRRGQSAPPPESERQRQRLQRLAEAAVLVNHPAAASLASRTAATTGGGSDMHGLRPPASAWAGGVNLSPAYAAAAPPLGAAAPVWPAGSPSFAGVGGGASACPQTNSFLSPQVRIHPPGGDGAGFGFQQQQPLRGAGGRAQPGGQLQPSAEDALSRLLEQAKEAELRGAEKLKGLKEEHDRIIQLAHGASPGHASPVPSVGTSSIIGNSHHMEEASRGLSASAAMAAAGGQMMPMPGVQANVPPHLMGQFVGDLSRNLAYGLGGNVGGLNSPSHMLVPPGGDMSRNPGYGFSGNVGGDPMMGASPSWQPHHLAPRQQDGAGGPFSHPEPFPGAMSMWDRPAGQFSPMNDGSHFQSPPVSTTDSAPQPPPAKSPNPEELDVEMKPGDMGIEVDWPLGLVKSVHPEGQLASSGVSAPSETRGYFIEKVNSAEYSDQALKAAMDGTSHYHLAFRRKDLPPPTPTAQPDLAANCKGDEAQKHSGFIGRLFGRK